MNVDKKGINSLELLADSGHSLREHFWQLFIFDIFFKICIAVVFGPLSALVLNKLISRSGSLVIGNDQILTFLLSPIGVLTLIISGTALLSVLFAEQAGFMLLASQPRSVHSPKSVGALWLTIRHFPKLLELGIRQLIVYVVYLIPFAAAGGVTYALLARQADINYLLTHRTFEFWIGTALAAILGIGALLVAAMLYIRWLFSVPICLFESARPAAAMRRSRRLVKGHMRKIVFIMLGWTLTISAAGGAIAYGYDFICHAILNRINENFSILLPATGLLLAIYVIIVEALTFIGFAVNCLLISKLYQAVQGLPELSSFSRVSTQAVDAHAQTGALKKIGTMAALLIILTTVGTFLIIEDIDLENQVAVTAHRGSSKYAPENSLSAVKRAIIDGADYAEIDVQETADGVIVLLHDTDLMRVAGVNRKIWEVSYDEIKALDAGSWFSPDFKGEPIATLEEIIEISAGKIKLNIELKFNGHAKLLTERVVKIIQTHNFESQSIISSLNYESLMRVKTLDPDLKVGFIIAKAIGNIFRSEVDFLNLSSNIVTKKVIDRAAKRGMEIHVWTVNHPRDMSYFMDLGVDNILTDFPDKLIALIKERAALSDSEKLIIMAGNYLRR